MAQLISDNSTRSSHRLQSSETRSRSAAGLIDFSAVWRRKLSILGCMLLFLAAGGAYVANTANVYEVQSRIMVRENNPSLDTSRPAVPDREFLATQAEIIRSPLIILAALKDVPIPVPSDYEKGDVAYVLESLTVTPVVQTHLLNILYRNGDPEKAKELTAALVRKYREFIAEGERGQFGDNLELLTKREIELREQLDRLQREYASFRKESPLIGQDRESITMATGQLALLGQKLSELRNRRIDLETKIQAYSAVSKKAITSGGQSKVINASQTDTRIADGLNPTSRKDDIGDNALASNIIRDASPTISEDLARIQQELLQAERRSKELSHKFGPKHVQTLAAQNQVTIRVVGYLSQGN